MGWAYSTRDKRNSYNILVGKPERKRPFGRPMHRWEDIIMNLREVGWENVDWVHLVQDRDPWWALVNTVLGPSDSIKGR
jgi:hypothetical protein